MTEPGSYIERAWIRQEQMARRLRKRAERVRALRQAADRLSGMVTTSKVPQAREAYIRIESAQVSLRLLASLAEHHAAPPPDYDDSLSDLSPYHWQRVVSDRRCERASLMRSSAEMVWEAGP